MLPTFPSLARSSQVSVHHTTRLFCLQTAAATLVFNWCSPVERSISGVGAKSQSERHTGSVPTSCPPGESTTPRPQHGGSPRLLAPTPGLDSGLASELWRLLPGGRTDAQEQPWSLESKAPPRPPLCRGAPATPRPWGLWVPRVLLLGSVVSHSHRVDLGSPNKRSTSLPWFNSYVQFFIPLVM